MKSTKVLSAEGTPEQNVYNWCHNESTDDAETQWQRRFSSIHRLILFQRYFCC